MIKALRKGGALYFSSFLSRAINLGGLIIVTKQGETRWVIDRTTVNRAEGGKSEEFQGIVIDITERKRAEEAVRQSEGVLRSLPEAGSGTCD